MNYRVHVYREMRTVFSVSAETQEEALKLALGMPLAKADAIEDCEGIAHGFLVDTLLPDGAIDYDVEWAGNLKDDEPVEDDDDEPGDRPACQVLGGPHHRDSGRGVCIDCGEFLPSADGDYWR